MFETILLTIEDRVATITLNRPELSNAFARESYIEVREALEQCGKDPEVGAVVITGAGKHFSAGGDIKRFKKLIDEKVYIQPENVTLTGEMSIAARKCPKPVIAMVNGAAAGAGCGLALACDFRVVTEKSKFIMAFINLGLSGDTAGMYHLAKLIGTARAIEFMMLGEPITGDKAYELGLATQLVTEEELVEATYKLAKKLANKPTYAISKQKETINNFFYSDIDSFILHEAKFMNETSHTEDFEEAVNAFLEKRKPVFKGR